MNNKQKLELTWIGKDNPEYDIANIEPRILEENPELSNCANDPSTENMLIHGDNLLALKALLPEYEGKVKCIYIDPPYNTGNAFEHYDDSVEHSTWLSLMRPRLDLLRMLLGDDGLFYVQLDDNEMHYMKILCDEVFGRDNFVACLPVIMNLKGNQDQFGFAGTHEYIIVFAKQKNLAKINQFNIDEDGLDEWEQDDIGYYKKGANLKATGVNAPREKRPNLFFPIFARSDGTIYITENDLPESEKDLVVLPTTDEKEMSWRWSKKKINAEITDIIISGNYSDKNVSFYKKQRPELGELPSKKPKSIFYKPEYSSGNGTSQIKTLFGSKSFSYPKPEDLIYDILYLSTKENDLVLDSFLGSGTTSAVAQKMNRKHIGIEMGDHAYTHCKVRLDKVINGNDGLKLSEAIGWSGGGAYKFYELAPSFIIKDEFGNPVIDGFYNDSKLIKAMCKLMNFTYQPSQTEYWKHGVGQGKNYLYITTQLLTSGMVQQIVGHLAEGESLIICPKKFEPGADKIDSRITIKKIPQSVLKACHFGKKEYLLPIKEAVMEEVDLELDEENDEVAI
jgi:adenine-specific DNA-methyltransferase